MLFPIWQPLYSSSHKLAQRVGEVLNTSVTHTGTLDPMAEGVLVLLTEDDRYGKSGFADWEKVYEFSILWGVQTDTGDRLGLLTNSSTQEVNLHQITETLQKFPTEYEQQLPDFSSRRWQGKSAFDFAKNYQLIPMKFRSVSINNLTTLMNESVSSDKILVTHNTSVNKITGDFRQKEIINSWSKTLEDEELNQKKWLITTHQATVSTGTYIRQLVQDFAKELQMPATTWSITRTKNGPFEREDCIALTDVVLLK